MRLVHAPRERRASVTRITESANQVLVLMRAHVHRHTSSHAQTHASTIFAQTGQGHVIRHMVNL